MAAKPKDQAGAFRLWVDTDGWTVDTVDQFVIDLIELAGEYGASPHVEIPLIAWTKPGHQWAQSEGERCRSVQTKPFHLTTRSNPERTAKGSSWRCGLIIGHDGMHRAPEHAKQAPWP